VNKGTISLKQYDAEMANREPIYGAG
jgi:hypothetical protein